MRPALCLVALLVLGATAHAVPVGPMSSVSDDAAVIEVKMIHPKMTCKEMMRMHRKMMSGKRMTCKEMIGMHRKMMGGKRMTMTCKEMMRMHRKMMGGHA
jgi:hypothetical protein